MTPYINHDILDAALNYIKDNTENLYITDDTGEPDTFTKASDTYKCGVKANPSFTGPTDGDVNGRKITVNEISDGDATADADAKYFALTDDSESKLLLYEELALVEAVADGGTFTLTEFIFKIKDPT